MYSHMVYGKICACVRAHVRECVRADKRIDRHSKIQYA